MPFIIFPSEVIDIDEGEPPENISALDFMHLYSIMCYPADEEARNNFSDGIIAGNTLHMIERAKEDIGSNVQVIADADAILRIAKAPDMNAMLRKAADDAAVGGSLSGLVLGWCIFRAERADTKASASPAAAFRMIEEAMSKGGWRGGSAENMKRNVWPTYRPVAHLWTAWSVWRDREYTDEELTTPKGMHLFLMMAEWFRAKGEAYTPLRSDAPLLPTDETWKIRPEVSEGWPDFRLECNNLDAWDLRKRIKPRD